MGHLESSVHRQFRIECSSGSIECSSGLGPKASGLGIEEKRTATYPVVHNPRNPHIGPFLDSIDLIMGLPDPVPINCV